MWDAVVHFLSHLLTLAWFAGAVLMLLTIPACIYKIFSALWEKDENEDEPQASPRAPRSIADKF